MAEKMTHCHCQKGLKDFEDLLYVLELAQDELTSINETFENVRPCTYRLIRVISHVEVGLTVILDDLKKCKKFEPADG